MKKLCSVLLLGVLACAGCRTFPPVQNVQHQSVSAQSMAAVEKAIEVGGTNKGWVVTKVRDGLMEATLNIRNHQVVVDIPYGADYYSILYKTSTNLRYNEKKGTIHPRYNTWIIYLNRSINAALAAQ